MVSMPTPDGDRTKTLTFTKETLAEFKKLYEDCKGLTFMFQGAEVFKGYAKYLIEFLENKERLDDIEKSVL